MNCFVLHNTINCIDCNLKTTYTSLNIDPIKPISCLYCQSHNVIIDTVLAPPKIPSTFSNIVRNLKECFTGNSLPQAVQKPLINNRYTNF